MYVTDKETLTKMVKLVTQDGVTVEGYHLRKKYCSSRKTEDRIPPNPFSETNVMPISKPNRKYKGEKKAMYQYS